MVALGFLEMQKGCMKKELQRSFHIFYKSQRRQEPSTNYPNGGWDFLKFGGWGVLSMCQKVACFSYKVDASRDPTRRVR
jgi:hypothetical protein